LLLRRQIEAASRHREHLAWFLPQATHDCRTRHPGMAGHEHAFPRQIEPDRQDIASPRW